MLSVSLRQDTDKNRLQYTILSYSATYRDRETSSLFFCSASSDYFFFFFVTVKCDLPCHCAYLEPGGGKSKFAFF